MRPLRHFVPGLPVHVLHRGNNRQPIFTCTGDFLAFRRVLEDACGDEPVAVHSFVLMTNHVHLVVTPDEEWALSRLMHRAIRNYAGYFNRRYRRTGTLWEGRFRASVIESDHYLFACHRYGDLNPVRAGMVQKPEEYPWSSHRFYAWGEGDSMLTPHSLIDGLSGVAARRQAAYRQLFEEPLAEDDLKAIRKAVQGGRALGGASIGKRRGRPPQESSLAPIIEPPPGNPSLTPIIVPGRPLRAVGSPESPAAAA